MVAPRKGLRGHAQSRQKLSKKLDLNLVGYTCRLKNYVRIPPPPHLSSFLKAGAATDFQGLYLKSIDSFKNTTLYLRNDITQCCVISFLKYKVVFLKELINSNKVYTTCKTNFVILLYLKTSLVF